MKIEHSTDPYPHYIIDNFLDARLAHQLAEEFPDPTSSKWFVYDSPLEVKKAINSWYEFPPTTYQFIQHLMSPTFIRTIQQLTGVDVFPDYGLHGGGWHLQGNGGLLNVHLDYNVHPKTYQKRKFTLIVYLSDWLPQWGGNLELWSHDDVNNKPKDLVRIVECKFNRAVLFDASQNSWHGFSDAIQCPPDVYRKSIACYYLVDRESTDVHRTRALYSPRADQQNDQVIADLIKQRTQ
jgi:Rps23 Pro-64 3,4-dihydroxylase Tpa1-like proline 4-hydroxylase